MTVETAYILPVIFNLGAETPKGAVKLMKGCRGWIIFVQQKCENFIYIYLLYYYIITHVIILK